MEHHIQPSVSFSLKKIIESIMPLDQLDILDERINESAILTLNRSNHSHAIIADMISSMLSKLLVSRLLYENVIFELMRIGKTYQEQSNINIVIIKWQGNKALAAGRSDSGSLFLYVNVYSQTMLMTFNPHRSIND